MRQWIVPRDTWWTVKRLETFARLTGIELVEISIAGTFLGCTAFLCERQVFVAVIKTRRVWIFDEDVVIAAVYNGEQRYSDWSMRFQHTNERTISGTQWDRMIPSYEETAT